MQQDMNKGQKGYGSSVFGAVAPVAAEQIPVSRPYYTIKLPSGGEAVFERDRSDEAREKAGHRRIRFNDESRKEKMPWPSVEMTLPEGRAEFTSLRVLQERTEKLQKEKHPRAEDFEAVLRTFMDLNRPERHEIAAARSQAVRNKSRKNENF